MAQVEGPRGSRFAGWPRWAKLLLLGALIALAAFGAMARDPVDGHKANSARSAHAPRDVELYAEIASGVGAGQDYYAAAVAAQREKHYPLRPFVTVRLPTLAELIALLGAPGAKLLLGLIGISAVGALTIRLRRERGAGPTWIAAVVLVAASIALVAQPAMVWWHEAWAALLIALSLALRTRERWALSLLAGLAAVLIREHAAIYLGVMASCAASERRWKEAAGWAGAITLFALLLSAHALALSSRVTALDIASPGWSGFGGWPFLLAMAQRSTIFALLPAALTAIAVPLALLGWCGLSGDMGKRAAGALLLYTAVFLLLGRPDNFYWGLLIAPLLAAGLAFAPGAIRDLLASPRREPPLP